MASEPRVPRPFSIAAVLAILIGASTFAISSHFQPAEFSLQALFLVCAVLLSENFAFSLPPYTVSLSHPLTVAAMVLCGPTIAAVVAAASSTSYREIAERKPVEAIAFNLGQLVFVTCVGGWLYRALGGRVLQTGLWAFKPVVVSDFPWVIVPLATVAVACAVLNLGLTAVGVSLLHGLKLRELAPAILEYMPTQIALAFVGFLIAQVLAISAFALPLFIAPLVVARQLYLRYSQLKDAFADTVRSLVGALEAKDPYTRGHSERVAKYAVELGQAMRLDAGSLERLEYAALLHDLGKLAVPGAVLTKPGKLDEGEMASIREHPGRGADMIALIPPLRDLSQVIRQHHERLDGEGYPAGTAGEGLLLQSRILAVADSYDAMTTTRAYRPALDRARAIRELEEGSGTQFDAEVVHAFVRAGIGLAAAMPQNAELEETVSAALSPQEAS
jgi:HD-GYP domain-containing protein (c-di-GMP phosphodiesterase class II)